MRRSGRKGGTEYRKPVEEAAERTHPHFLLIITVALAIMHVCASV